MKITRDKLRQIIKEELEEMMSVSEADIKVSVSPQQPILTSQEDSLYKHNSVLPVMINGKKYFVKLFNDKALVYDYSQDFMDYLFGNIRDPEKRLQIGKIVNGQGIQDFALKDKAKIEYKNLEKQLKKGTANKPTKRR